MSASKYQIVDPIDMEPASNLKLHEKEDVIYLMQNGNSTRVMPINR
jgi:hypothetical protein